MSTYFSAGVFTHTNTSSTKRTLLWTQSEVFFVQWEVAVLFDATVFLTPEWMNVCMHAHYIFHTLHSYNIGNNVGLHGG